MNAKLQLCLGLALLGLHRFLTRKPVSPPAASIPPGTAHPPASPPPLPGTGKAPAGPPRITGGFFRKARYLVLVTLREWTQDNILRLSAALSYYTVFSLAPLLILLLMVCGSMFGPEAVQGHLSGQLTRIMGPRPAAALEEMIAGAMKPPSGTWAAMASVAALIFGASGVFGEVKDALNRIWGAPEKKKVTAIWNWTRTRLLSFGMVVSIMFLLLVSFAFSTFLSFASTWFSERFQVHPDVWSALGFLTSLAVETVLFALVFRVLPDVRFPWRDVWWGAAATALLFEAGKWALSWYLGRESTASTYGAANSLMLLLLWIYYSSIIVLTGAEITQVRSRMLSGQPEPVPES